MLVYQPDLSDWYFCEVKGPTDRLRPEQEEYFEALSQVSGKEIKILRFQEGGSGNLDRCLTLILTRIRDQGYSQVEGYKRFRYLRETPKSVILIRETGGEARIPFEKIRQALGAVQENPKVYSAGPGSLREYGITHINSPIWSLIHLVTLAEILAKA